MKRPKARIVEEILFAYSEQMPLLREKLENSINNTIFVESTVVLGHMSRYQWHSSYCLRKWPGDNKLVTIVQKLVKYSRKLGSEETTYERGQS